MENIEICDLAVNVISSIEKDLNDSFYAERKGTLSVSWKTDEKFNAWAATNSKVDEPPIHTVGMYYELACQLYRYIDEYCFYIESGCDQKIFDEIFKDDSKPVTILPSKFSKSDYRKNMFMSALTWVFFHEIGHLYQEHGYIRSQLSKTNDLSIHECDIDNSEILEGKAAAIYHVTEIAADYEAVKTCILELIRHFKGADLEDSIRTFICAVSIVLYRFHGVKSLQLNSKPKGSHPIPLVRLDLILSQIWETFDWAAIRSISGINFDRSELVHLCSRNATTVGIFWLRKHPDPPEIPSDFFLPVGIINKPGGKDYMQTIINTWDEIEPEIMKNKRSDNPLTVLSFSEQYRHLIFDRW